MNMKRKQVCHYEIIRERLKQSEVVNACWSADSVKLKLLLNDTAAISASQVFLPASGKNKKSVIN